MSYEFKRLGEVEALENVPEGANALIEVDGVIKRAPGTGLGGSGSGKTLILSSSYFDIVASGGSLPQEKSTSETIMANMTFSEFKEAFRNKEIASAVCYGVYIEGDYGDILKTYCNTMWITDITADCEEECFALEEDSSYYWTAGGFLEYPPYKK